MLDVETYRDLARLSGERRLRLLEGGDPRLEPIATGEGLGGSRDVAPQPSFMGRRNPISAVSAPAGTPQEAGS